MNKSSFIIFCLGAMVNPISANIDQEWEDYKTKFNKVYKSISEDKMRKAIFMKKKEEVDNFNKNEAKKAGWRKGINQFSDMTFEEKMSMCMRDYDEEEYLAT